MYVTSIAIPIAFDAQDDAQANVIAHKLAEFYAGLEFDPALRERFSAEVTDMPQPLELSEVLPYVPQRTVELNSFLALQAETCEANGHRFNDLGQCEDCDA
jgi:hypothetical protein